MQWSPQLNKLHKFLYQHQASFRRDMEKHFLFLSVKTISHPSGSNFSIFFSQNQYIVSAIEVVIDFADMKPWDAKEPSLEDKT